MILMKIFLSDAYNYGYEISPSGQFHHEVRGPDDITYGCYGYIDPYGKLKTTFYISDGWGYRVVQPGNAVELFLHEHEHHHDESNQENHDDHDDHDHHDHHDHHGVITEWKDLYFPQICRQFDGTGSGPGMPPMGGGKKYTYLKIIDIDKQHLQVC